MASTIQIKRGTGSAVPSGLADGELAINLDSGRFYFGSGSTSVNDFSFGEITAEKYIVSSSVLYVTTSFSSGSTEFGDSSDDTHTFTGDITASGDISASGAIHGTIFTTSPGGRVQSATDSGLLLQADANTTYTVDYTRNGVGQHIFKKGTTNLFTLDETGADFPSDITASGCVRAGDIVIDGGSSTTAILKFTGSGDPQGGITYTDSSNSGRYALFFPEPDLVSIANRASNGAVQIRANNSTAGGGGEVTSSIFTSFSNEFLLPVTASGNISASGYIYADRLYANNQIALTNEGGQIVLGNDNTYPIRIGKSTNPITINGHITASGNISSSGTVTGLTGSFNQLSVTSTGDTASPPLDGHLFRITDTSNNNPDIDHFFVENDALTYGMRWHYDGGDNDFKLYRHNNDAAGTPVIKFNRGDDNIMVYGSLSGVSTLGGQTDAVLNISADSDIVYIADNDGDEVGQHIFKDRTTTLLTVDETGADFLSNITASGNISASGTITADRFLGSQLTMVPFNYYVSANHTSELYIPQGGSQVESNYDNPYHLMLAPYDGKVRRVSVYYQTGDPGDLTARVRTAAAPFDLDDAADIIQAETVSSGVDDTAYFFDFSASFSKGEAIAVTLEAASHSSNCYVVGAIAVEYDTTT